MNTFLDLRISVKYILENMIKDLKFKYRDSEINSEFFYLGMMNNSAITFEYKVNSEKFDNKKVNLVFTREEETNMLNNFLKKSDERLAEVLSAVIIFESFKANESELKHEKMVEFLSLAQEVIDDLSNKYNISNKQARKLFKI